MRKKIIRRVTIYNIVLSMLVFIISVLASETQPRVEAAFSNVSVVADVVSKPYIEYTVKKEELPENKYSMEELAFIHAKDNDPNFYKIGYNEADINTISILSLEDSKSENSDEPEEPVIQEEEVIWEDPKIVAMKDRGEDVPDIDERSVKIFESEALSAELQWYAKDLCDENGIDIKLFMALMWKESRYDPKVIGGGRDYGLCQIRDSNHAYLEDKLNITDFLDPKQNMRAGVYMLVDAMTYYPDDSIHLALMVYNGGPEYARRLVSNGKYSSEYSREIVDYAKLLEYTTDKILYVINK